MLHLPQNKGMLNKGDPYFSSVVFLCGGRGSNGATSFADESKNRAVLTANGNVNTSNAQTKFGGSSASFDGVGDYIEAPAISDYDLGAQFTVEAWVYFTSTPTNSVIYSRWSGSSTDSRWALFMESGHLYFTFKNSSGGAEDAHAFAWAPPLNLWMHIAVDRADGTVRLYRDGKMLIYAALSANMRTSGTAPTLSVGLIQGFASTYDFAGYLSEMRITNGVARYASDAGFAVPTGPFPRY